MCHPEVLFKILESKKLICTPNNSVRALNRRVFRDIIEIPRANGGNKNVAVMRE